MEYLVYTEPRFEKLEKELCNFFENNLIEGKSIKKFILEKGIFNYEIIPEEPSFESCLSGGDYIEKLRNLGLKYGIDDLDFATFCYHK